MSPASPSAEGSAATQLEGDPIKVLIVDDQQMFREGISARLDQEPDISVVGEAESADAAFELIEAERPDLVTLDIRLPNVSGVEIAKKIRKDWPETKILILSGYDFVGYIKATARAGIEGYLLKDAPQEELVDAIRVIADGGAVVPPPIASKVMKTYAELPVRPREREVEELTAREIEILELIFQGTSNAEIGEHLDISHRTAHTHTRSIVSKLGARSRNDAVRIAVEMDLIQ